MRQYDNFTNILKLHNPKSEHRIQHKNYLTTTLPLSQDEITQPAIEHTQQLENSASNLIEDNQTQPISEQTQLQENIPFPLGPFSQRTHRLLTSPIKINSINNNTQPDTDNLSQYSLPDMENVLKDFGAECNTSQRINLEHIDNNMASDTDVNFCDIESNTGATTSDTETEPSISQRIRMLRRKCKQSQNNRLTNENSLSPTNPRRLYE